MKTFLVLTALVACQLAAAQKTIELKSFDKIAASGNIELKLIKSAENKLVNTEGNDKGLKLASEAGYLALSYEKSGDGIEATVYYTEAIDEISVSGGVEIHCKNTLTSPSLNLNAAAGSELHIAAEVKDMTIAAASGAEITITGTAKRLNAAVASGGELNAGKLVTENTVITVASGGEAIVNATTEVTATVADAGEIKIHGNPKKVNEVKAHGGEITMVK